MMNNLDRIKNSTDNQIIEILNDFANYWDSVGASTLPKTELIKDWLNHEKIELSQFEYDLLINCTQINNHNPIDKLDKYWIIEGMQQKGHFKNIDLDMTFKEVLERVVIVDE